MADIISADAPIATRRLEMQGVLVPLGALVSLIKAMPGSIGKAFAMAYAEPYAALHKPVVQDETLEGRDPNW